MKKIISFLFLAFFLSSGINAQISHDLEIYSEEGLMFTLYLNGRKMNEQVVSNIQIMNTDKDYVQAKIVFEDAAIPPLEKKFLQLAEPGEGSSKAPVSVVYKIVEGKKGDYKLRFASRSEKKIQSNQEIIIVEPYSYPVNGKIVIMW
jgi:hypothetical protein